MTKSTFPHIITVKTSHHILIIYGKFIMLAIISNKQMWLTRHKHITINTHSHTSYIAAPHHVTAPIGCCWNMIG